MYIHPDDIQGKEVCFLLTVNWEGMEYRFSTVPIDLENTATNQVYQYTGGLSDPDITQSSDFTGIDMEADSVSVELVFLGTNWVKEWLQGHSIVHSECVLAMVPFLDGYTKFTEQDKIILFKGKAIDPIIGSPNRPEGHVIFSIENSLNVVKVKLLEDQQEINVTQFPGLDQRAGVLGRTISYPVGKYVPWVFGDIGVWVQRQTINKIFRTDLDGDLEFIDQAQVSPCYTVDTTGSGASLETTYVIALGEVAADRVRIWDETGGNFVNDVELVTNTDGLLVSQVKYQFGSVIEDNSFIPGLDTDQTFWVSWGEYDGAAIDPISGESLTPATNLILYILDKVGLEYNRDKWMGLSSLLNRYKFGGYVNDPSILALDWLKEQILAHLPIQVFNGDGLEPKVDLYHYTNYIHPSYYLRDTGEFQILTGIQPMDVNVVNKVVLRFCYAGQFNQYLSTITIDPTAEREGGTNLRDPISDISFQRYGLKEEVVECPFIWDYDTAVRVARDKIRTRGLGVYALEIQAASKYGYLQVGDVIALTSTNLSLDAHKCQIIQKSWAGVSWNFVIHLEANSLVNPRQLV